ncbi:STELLO glycosyltransferase family protein [Polynucleobacter sp. IMCC 29146]|uniref:STELLO glycosyltransferase family protein n=1 Tax=Polynucleobacter sp. IMCC 29146 TaxID=2780953 RepID=UPI001F4262E1|nr:STELLO glycosyltransferase family protein [Polynucleobacter sp. IMCC 29146]MCE7530681.1 STELLO glycosyltransferase family protein [Polynucleobacter sp. IMCC 29146]
MPQNLADTALVITSIGSDTHPILGQYAAQAKNRNLLFIVIGDSKSPAQFELPGCSYYSLPAQLDLNFPLAKQLPIKHYGRKNLGYLLAIEAGKKIIVETDDDNIPLDSFWQPRSRTLAAKAIHHQGWVNAYCYFTDQAIWPRGFALEELKSIPPQTTKELRPITCPIQQGLADENPDVDAIYRLTMPLPINFDPAASNITLGQGAICPFNSQNTTWFEEAFLLLYLPSYCSFRMTDIWRSYIAQRIAWTCEWPIAFHTSTVRQERNAHNLMNDFSDEIVGYVNNLQIMEKLNGLSLESGQKNIPNNMRQCYQELINLGVIGAQEMVLLELWLENFS